MLKKYSPEVIKQANEFLNVAAQFKLGRLDTESPHPLTKQLSYWANNDIDKAINTLVNIDISALQAIFSQLPLIEQLKKDIAQTLNSGHKVFMCGCGATGRLSLSLEFFWRQTMYQTMYKDQVIGFMAGGDSAIIKSIENFEDHPEYGAKMLDELEFQDQDLMIGITEGGETPYVIGATEHSLKLGTKSAYFLYCNPDIQLMPIERSRNVIENNRIHKINLSSGPMSLTGSTRLQASTVQMIAVGLALLSFEKNISIDQALRDLIDAYKKVPATSLKPFIEKEASIYKDNRSVLYRTKDYGITILTDTTERSPTFSLLPFENVHDQSVRPALAYLSIIDTKNAAEAWSKVFLRKPRTLSWPIFKGIADDYYVSGFNLSDEAISLRQERWTNKPQAIFSVLSLPSGFELKFEELTQSFAYPTDHPLSILIGHSILKMLMNMHSTLVMGRLDRYLGNLMTYVMPSNKKLIDRAIRYIEIIAANEGLSYSYEEIAYELFNQIQTLQRNEPIVLKTFESLKSNT